MVLYEMVAGRRPFEEEYEHAVVYSILNEQPEPLTAIAQAFPKSSSRYAATWPKPLRCERDSPLGVASYPRFKAGDARPPVVGYPGPTSRAVGGRATE